VQCVGPGILTSDLFSNQRLRLTQYFALLRVSRAMNGVVDREPLHTIDFVVVLAHVSTRKSR